LTEREYRVRHDRSLADVFQDIVRNVQEIIRAEIALARTEVRQEASKAVSSLAWVVVGALSGLFAVVFILWTAAYALGLLWPMWAATLVVAGVLTLSAIGLLTIGIRRLRELHPTPERTVQTIKENVAWVRQSSK
jgi:Putative Actinobacterial Holin-X, holin superfamily III